MSKDQLDSAPIRLDVSEALRDPACDLFLWAVVQNNEELAQIAWEQVSRPLTENVDSSFILYLYLHSAETACPLLWLPARS